MMILKLDHFTTEIHGFRDPHFQNPLCTCASHVHVPVCVYISIAYGDIYTISTCREP